MAMNFFGVRSEMKSELVDDWRQRSWQTILVIEIGWLIEGVDDGDKQADGGKTRKNATAAAAHVFSCARKEKSTSREH